MNDRILLASSLFLLSGCVFTLPGLDEPAEEDKFQCVGTCIGDSQVSLPTGRLYDGPLPAQTSFGDEPVIASTKWVDLEPGVAALEVEVEVAAPTTGTSDWRLTEFYMEINGKVYAIDPVEIEGSGSADIDACNVLAEQQGYSCTQACLDACSCVNCTDATMEKNVVNSCAVNCSVYSHQGLIGPEPYTSEQVMAELIYNGDANLGLTGMLQSMPGCDGQVCSDRAQAQVSVQKMKRAYLKFAYPSVPQLESLNVDRLCSSSKPETDQYVSSPDEIYGKARISGSTSLAQITMRERAQ